MSASAISIGPSVVKMALFTAVTLVCTGTLAVMIGNTDFGPKNTYQAVFSDAVGVSKGDDVRMSGVRVGAVEKIELHENAHALVTFTVDEALPLATSTRIAVRYRNLIGQRYLAMTEAAGTGARLQPGGILPITQTKPALNLTVLFNGFKPLLTGLNPADVNTLAYELVRVLQGEGGTVSSLLGHLSSLTNSLADRDALIGQVVDNLNGVLGPLDDHSQEVTALIANLQELVTGLAGDREAIGSSLVSLGELADTTAGLLEEGRPALKTDIAELGKAAAGLNTPTNQDLIEQTVQGFPAKLKVVKPVFSYGSWINFYLCAVNFKTGPDLQDSTPVMLAEAPRCQE